MFKKIKDFLHRQEEKLAEESSIEETTVIETVESFKNATGLEFIANGIKWIAAGTFMGMSDAVPGYSGGTTLALLGIYKRIVLIAKSVFMPEPGLTRIKALLFMVPFLLGWIAGVFGFAKLTELMFEHGLQLELMFFFSGFIIFAIPIYMRSSQLGLFRNLKEPTKENLEARKHRRIRWTLFFIGFFAVIGVAIYLLVTQHGAKIIINHKRNVNSRYIYDISHDWWKLLLVAYFAGFLSIIPGGSGAIIQLLSGEYINIHTRIMAHFKDNVGGLFMFAGSTLLGMLSMVFLMSWVLKKHAKTTAALSFGMLIAAAAAVIIIIPAGVHDGNKYLNSWEEAKNHKWHIGTTIVSFVVGCLFASFINYWTKRKNKNRKLKRAT